MSPQAPNPQAPRVYADSSVLVSASHKKHKFYYYAQNFLIKTQHGDYKTIISVLAIMEGIKGIRGFLVALGQRDPQKWNEATQDFLTMLLALKNVEFIQGTPSERTTERQPSFAEILWKAFDILAKYSGKAVDHDEGGNRLPTLRHDGLGADDAIHIELAKEASCRYLATTDKDFLESRSEIEPLLLG